MADQHAPRPNDRGQEPQPVDQGDLEAAAAPWPLPEVGAEAGPVNGDDHLAHADGPERPAEGGAAADAAQVGQGEDEALPGLDPAVAAPGEGELQGNPVAAPRRGEPQVNPDEEQRRQQRYRVIIDAADAALQQQRRVAEFLALQQRGPFRPGPINIVHPNVRMDEVWGRDPRPARGAINVRDLLEVLERDPEDGGRANDGAVGAAVIPRGLAEAAAGNEAGDNGAAPDNPVEAAETDSMSDYPTSVDGNSNRTYTIRPEINGMTGDKGYGFGLSLSQSLSFSCNPAGCRQKMTTRTGQGDQDPPPDQDEERPDSDC